LLVAALPLVLAPVAHASSGGGLVLIPDMTKVVVLLVGFVALVPVVSSLIVRPVYGVIDERAERIDGARKRAAALEESANEVLTRYENAVREVREESERERRQHIDAARSEHAQITGRARAEAEREIEQSQTELQASLSDARAGLRTTAEDLARQAAERILGRPVA
jgi:F0F1-type ATP synthase membrane subunit b/b'